MKYLIGLLSVLLVFVANSSLFACTGFYVGKKVSADGTTLIARTVDSISVSVTKRLVIIPRVENTPGRIWQASDTSASWPLPATTFRSITVPSVAWKGRGRYDGAGVNEKGVMLSATVTGGTNDAAKKADPFVKEGVGESSLPELLIQSAATAREMVELLGKVVETVGHHGAEIYMMADKDEAWYVEVYTGHQWAAVKMPEDKMMVIGNQFLLREFDPSSPDTLSSKGLVMVPTEAGFLKCGQHGHIDLALTYATEPIAADTMRTWFGHKRFAPGTEGEYVVTRRMPLFFRPSAKVSIRDLEEATRWRYEGTGMCPEEDGDPATVRVIGVGRQCSCHVLTLDDALPPERRCTLWVTLANAEHAPFMPVNAAIEALAEGFDREGLDGSRAFHPEFPAMHFRRLAALSAVDRKMYGAGVREFWRAKEDRWLAEYPQLVREGNVKAITDYSVRVQRESLADAKRIFDDLSWYITRMNFNLGDYRSPDFAPERKPYSLCEK